MNPALGAEDRPTATSLRPRVFGGMTMTDQEVQFAYILLVGLLLVWLWARDID